MADPSSQTPGIAEDSTDRLEKIHQTWIRERKRTPRMAWGSDSVLGNARGMGLLIALFLGALCIQTDSVLWSGTTNTETPSFVHYVEGWRLAAVVLLLSLVNGLLLDLSLADLTGGHQRLRPLARGSRFLASGVPLLGLAAPALWFWLTQNRRTWIDRPGRANGYRPPTGRLAATRERLRRLFEKKISPLGRRFLESEWTLYWVLVSNIALPFAVIFWLSNPVTMTRGRYAVILTISAFAHLAAFIGTSYFFIHLYREQTARWSRLLIAVLPLLWLIPVPLLFFLGFIPMIFVRSSRGEDTLVGALYDNRESAGRLGSWRNLEQALKERRPKMTLWERFRLRNLKRLPAPDIEQRRLLLLYKGKSAVLYFDVIYVFGALASLRKWMPAIAGTLEWVLGAVALSALVLGGIAFAVHLTVVVSRITGSKTRLRILDKHPCAFYLGVTQLVFFIGYFSGSSLQKGEGEPIAGLLMVAGLLGLLGQLATFLLPIPERIRYNPPELIVWVFLFGGMVFTGVGLMGEPERLKAWMALLGAIAPFYTLMGAGFGVAFADWLLRPFTARQMFDRGLSRRRRVLIAVLALTAVLPLGGLFVPLWIYARYRWPAKVPVH